MVDSKEDKVEELTASTLFIYDLAVRVTAIEKLLVEKGTITLSDYERVYTSLLEKLNREIPKSVNNIMTNGGE